MLKDDFTYTCSSLEQYGSVNQCDPTIPPLYNWISNYNRYKTQELKTCTDLLLLENLYKAVKFFFISILKMSNGQVKVLIRAMATVVYLSELL